VRQIFPVAGQDLPVTAAATAGPLPRGVAELASLYRNVAATDPARPQRRWWLRANMVASTDGAVSLDGRSGGLSGPADRMIFTVLRSLADVILVGAGTARTERYRPASSAGLWAALRPEGAPPPPVALVSASLNLGGCEQLLTAPAGPSQTILITTPAAAAAHKASIAGRARIIEAGQEMVDLSAAFGALADLGYASILTEGGPTLLGQLADTGLLDELCLTTSPVLAAGTAGRIVTPPPGRQAAPAARQRAASATAVSRLRLAHVLADDSFLFSRYLREGPIEDAPG
jgi:riboflavin biosynthesis pyrimidine reductase